MGRILQFRKRLRLGKEEIKIWDRRLMLAGLLRKASVNPEMRSLLGDSLDTFVDTREVLGFGIRPTEQRLAHIDSPNGGESSDIITIKYDGTDEWLLNGGITPHLTVTQEVTVGKKQVYSKLSGEISIEDEPFPAALAEGLEQRLKYRVPESKTTKVIQGDKLYIKFEGEESKVGLIERTAINPKVDLGAILDRGLPEIKELLKWAGLVTGGNNSYLNQAINYMHNTFVENGIESLIVPWDVSITNFPYKTVKRKEGWNTQDDEHYLTVEVPSNIGMVTVPDRDFISIEPTSFDYRILLRAPIPVLEGRAPAPFNPANSVYLPTIRAKIVLDPAMHLGEEYQYTAETRKLIEEGITLYVKRALGGEQISGAALFEFKPEQAPLVMNAIRDAYSEIEENEGWALKVARR